MKIAHVVLGNGRTDYLAAAVDSAFEMLPDVDYRIMVDDSGDPTVRRHLTREYPDFTHVQHDTNLGMAKAVQSCWDAVLQTDADYVFHQEEDMVLTAPIPVDGAIEVLDAHPNVVQMLFQRQCLTPDEHAAGSVLGAMRPLHWQWNERRYATQEHIFSLNPCLIPRRVCELGWPFDNEAGMTRRLLDLGYVFGVWLDGPLVEHVGSERAQAWQL